MGIRIRNPDPQLEKMLDRLSRLLFCRTEVAACVSSVIILLHNFLISLSVHEYVE
jgi:hypothetical protein